MALTNFSELKTAVLLWAERTADFSSYATDFVTLADVRIRKALAKSSIRIREMETTADVTPSSGVCTLPTDFMAISRVQARTTSPRRLEYKSQDWLDEAYPDGASGPPSFYTITGAGLLIYPLTTSDIRITYYAYPAVLSDNSTSNWLLTKYPDIYLYAGLTELEIFADNMEGSQKWKALFDAAMADLASASFGAHIGPGTSRTASQAAQ